MLRSARERLFQTLLFEAGGLLLITPAYSVASGHGPVQSMGVMLALAAVALMWTPFHNTLFDVVEYRVAGRVASDRPHALRVVHAISHEVTMIVVTAPVLMMLGGHALRTALLIEVGLTAVYAVWAYVFHLLYDRWRPVDGKAVTS